MGKFMGKVTDTLGFTDYKGQKKATAAATNLQLQATESQLQSAREQRAMMERMGLTANAQWGGAAQSANDMLDPYAEFGAAALPAYASLMTPQGQYDYLENNPLFQAAVDRSGAQLSGTAAAAGKYNSGGLRNALFENYLSTGEDYIQRASDRAMGAIGVGGTAAAGQAGNIMNATAGGTNAMLNAAAMAGDSMGAMRDIYGTQGNVSSGGIMARYNANQAALEGGMQTIQNIFSGNGIRGGGSIPGMGPVSQVGGALSSFGPFMQGLGGMMQGGGGMMAMSDRRVKTDIVEIDRDDIGGVFEFRYIGSSQKYIGRMADELQKTRPGAVREIDGILHVTAEFAPRAA